VAVSACDACACLARAAVDFEGNGLSKQVNAIQKEITAKKKVRARLNGDTHAI
jgi:hypothetical protein